MGMEERPSPSYSPSRVEAKWQRIWEERGANSFSTEELRGSRSPYFNLMMFPYPSAEGLHVGNIYAFTGADIHGRFQRLRGHDVFEPIGFDAFGIHSENFALKHGTHPMDLIPANVANFTRQLRRIGGMFDWDHSVDTTAPDYYRWTQWIFLKLFEAGLAERKKAPVNWCTSCKTVLANEQVEDGRCERCDATVEQRVIAQWFFRISDYSQRLLDNLDHIDWSESTRKAQANWIGRSEGARLVFPVAGSDDVIEVFTTRPDTIFGATYMVLAPEHPLVERITAPSQREDVRAYVDRVAAMDVVSRQKTAGEKKTGVFTGGYCVNPATGAEIPIWIADYVLAGYGTGAIMAVPGHDERDFEFANEFGLPVVRVVAGPDEDADTPLDEAYTDHDAGHMVNSGRFDGMSVAEGKAAITADLAERGLGEQQVNYQLRDWCISRQRYWGPPIPIVYCPECGAVPVPERELPVILPRVEDFKPDDDGVSPLARVESWYSVDCPACGAAARRETDVSDTFLDSSWYFLRYPSVGDDAIAFDPDITRRWLPVNSYIGGNEHAVLHLMYARFITMALHDIGLLDFEEPFTRFRAHGIIVKDGRKMSKTRGNVVTPDPVIEEFGADTFRLYLMFLGPFTEGGDYRDDGIRGPLGFLRRLWDTVLRAADNDADPDPRLEGQLHRTIEQVTRQIADLQYNTCISGMMEYLNAVRAGGRRPARAEIEPVVLMVAPFAPHIAEELWERLGHEGGVFGRARWPEYDPEKARRRIVRLAVQVNGKVRGTIEGPSEMSRDDAEALARRQENVARFLQNGSVRRVIYVPGTADQPGGRVRSVPSRHAAVPREPSPLIRRCNRRVTRRLRILHNLRILRIGSRTLRKG